MGKKKIPTRYILKVLETIGFYHLYDPSPIIIDNDDTVIIVFMIGHTDNRLLIPFISLRL